MEAPKHTKAFDIEHARAGAPFCCANGDEVEILKWDRKHTLCIVGLCRQDAAVRTWRTDGSYADAFSAAFLLVMTPLGHIDGKPVFVGDKVVLDDGMAAPTVHLAEPKDRSFANCRWPAPEKQYPVTQMDVADLYVVYLQNQKPTYYAGFAAIANAALRHAVDNDQLVPMAEVLDVARSLRKREFDQQSMDLGKAERLLESLGYRSAGAGDWTQPAGRHFYGQVNGIYVEGDANSIKVVQDLAERGAARDMAIAEAVRDACYDAVMICSNGLEGAVIRQAHLSTIIAKVQP